MLIHNAAAYIDGSFTDSMDVRVENRRVTALGKDLPRLRDEEVLNAGGRYLLPGFVDVHIHGCAGADTMNGESDIRRMSRFLAEMGVAAFLPTTMSASAEATKAAVSGIRSVMESPEVSGACVLGAHLEAPFLQPGKCGAQDAAYFLLPEMKALTELTGGDLSCVRLMTMAPELEGSEAVIRQAYAAGIHISLGHTAANAAQVHAAADWGADHITHTFNAQTPLHHREPGVPGAALTDDRLYCEMISDTIHLHPDILNLIWRAKGAAHTVVITDAMEAAGMPDGTYSLGGQAVMVHKGRAELQDGTLAGSVLTMPQALRNLIRQARIPAADAVRMCTQSPAESIGEAEYGRLFKGVHTPLTLWDHAWDQYTVIM